MEKDRGIIDLAVEREKRLKTAPDAVVDFDGAEDETELDTSHFLYHVDNDLVREGWRPFSFVEINTGTLKNREEVRKLAGWKNVQEKESTIKESGKPCLVFYGKN